MLTKLDEIIKKIETWSGTYEDVKGQANDVTKNNNTSIAQSTMQLTAAQNANASKDIRKATVSKINSDIAASGIDFDNVTNGWRTSKR